jgi:hypothetical protein
LEQSSYNLQKVFSDRLFRVPDYQRGYAWEEQQWRDLVEDLELLAPGHDHYIGTLILHQSEEQSTLVDSEGTNYAIFSVVDGQQRLTTLVVLLNTACQSMQSIDGRAALSQGIRKRYVITTDRNGLPLPKLTLNRDCHDFYVKAILENAPILTGPTIRSHELLSAAATYFSNYLASKRSDLGSAYPGWLDSLVEKICIRLTHLVYTLNSAAEAGVVFETMNNRGRPLNEMEKVKNFLLYAATKLDPDAESHLTDVTNGAWTHILESLMAADLGSASNEDQLLRVHWLMAYDYQSTNWEKNRSRSIKDWFKPQKYVTDKSKWLHGLLAYVESLRNSATAYCDINSPNRLESFADFKSEPELRNEVIRWSEKLTRLGSPASFLPFLIAIRHRASGNAAMYLEAIRLCERFIFRVYDVLDRPAYTARTVLHRLGNQVYSGRDISGALDELRANLLAYCSQETYEKRLRERQDWYSWRGVKYFLYEYELRLAQLAGHPVKVGWAELKEPKESIEHILPQNPSADGYWQSRFNETARKTYTHDIGNLCLTLDNSWLGNKPFPEKVGDAGRVVGYANSKLYSEHALAGYKDWAPAEIEARRKELLAWADQRWHVEALPGSEGGSVSQATGKFARVEQLADTYGCGEIFQQIHEAASAHGLYARAFKSSIVYTTASNHLRSVFTVWPQAGRLDVGIWLPPTFEHHERMRQLFGANPWHKVSGENIDDFIDRLHRVFNDGDIA